MMNAKKKNGLSRIQVILYFTESLPVIVRQTVWFERCGWDCSRCSSEWGQRKREEEQEISVTVSLSTWRDRETVTGWDGW